LVVEDDDTNLTLEVFGSLKEIAEFFIGDPDDVFAVAFTVTL